MTNQSSFFSGRNTEEWFNQILSESDEQLIKRKKESFKKIISSCSRGVVLFGAGSIGKKILHSLRKNQIEPLAFIDNDERKQGKNLDGVTIYSPQQGVEKFGIDCFFLVSAWSAKFSFRLAVNQLTSLGVQKIEHSLPLMWNDDIKILPNYALDHPEKILLNKDAILHAFQLLGDEKSRRVFVDNITIRLLGDFNFASDVEDWPATDIFNELDQEVIVDAGAFDGDTVVEFMDRFREKIWKIYAVEPDSNNFIKLQERVALFPNNLREKVILCKIALGSEVAKVSFSSQGTMASSINGNGTTTVDCMTIDQAFSQPRPTYVKLDIEGGEVEALKGATQTLQDSPIVWSVTTEHRFDDIWKIPTLIKSINPALNIFLRSHGNEGWDLICYAVPNSRLNKS